MPTAFASPRGARGLRPSGPVVTNQASPQATGLVWRASPSTLTATRDLAGVGGPMTLTSGTLLRGVVAGGAGLLVNAADRGAYQVAPQAVKLANGLTYVVTGYFTGTGDSGANLFGVTYDNAVNSPYWNGLAWNGIGGLIVYSGAVNATLALSPVVGKLFSIVLSVSGSGTFATYVNGTPDVTGSYGPTYSATSQVMLGDARGIGRSAAFVFLDARIYSRAWSALDAQQHALFPWDLDQVPSTRAYVNAVAAGAFFPRFSKPVRQAVNRASTY